MPNAVQLEKDGFWVTLWFNKPEKRNAFTADLLVELKQALVELRDDKSVRGITIRGRGGFFCAGGDLKMFKDTLAGGGERQAVIDTSCQIAEILDLVNTMPKLVVVLIEGAAMAGGFGLACCADVVICQNSAKFAMTETTLGLSPAQIAPFAIQKLGYSTARMLMLTAARFNGQESLAYGFANYTANTCEELEEIEQKLRDQLRNCGPEAIAATKDLLLKLPALDRNEA
ncbi:MAG: enoyl-CoA hydratase/isomerase family protein, partial [Alphaproteobacteria bacterium]